MRVLIGIALAACCCCDRAAAVLALDPSLRISQYAHGVDGARRCLQGSHQLDRADARGICGSAPSSVCFASTESDTCSGSRRQASTPQHQYPQRVCRQRRPSVDRHTARAGKLEGRDADPSPGGDGTVGSMLEDRDGTVWAGTRAPPPGKLCAFGGMACSATARRGSSASGPARYTRTAPATSGSGPRPHYGGGNLARPRYPLVNFESSHGIVEMDEGALVIAERDKLRQLVGEGSLSTTPWINRLNTQFAHMLRDRDGALWIGTLDRGLIRVHRDRVDLFSRADGLSSNYVRGLLEDREGNIWVATDNGLDRFRHGGHDDFGEPRVVGRHALVGAAGQRRQRLGGHGERIEPLEGRADHAVRRDGRPLPQDLAGPARRVVTDAGLPHDLIQSLFEDHRQRIWVSTHRGVVVFEHGRFSPVDGLPSVCRHSPEMPRATSGSARTRR